VNNAAHRREKLPMPGLVTGATLSWAEPMNLSFSAQVGFAPSMPRANAQHNEVYSLLVSQQLAHLRCLNKISAKTVDIPRLSMLVWACPDQGRSHCH
jgi:hypothetical protein